MSPFWVGFLCGAVIMTMLLIVALGFWACCWGRWRDRCTRR